MVDNQLRHRLGVAGAGSIAIAAGSGWRIAWIMFVVLAVNAGITAGLLTPAHSARTVSEHSPNTAA